MNQRDLDDLKRANKEILVRITEVNMTQRIIWAVSRGIKGIQYQISVAGLDPLVAIPRTGEIWRIAGTADHSWRLVQRLEDGSENTGLDNMKEGDRRIDDHSVVIDPALLEIELNSLIYNV